MTIKSDQWIRRMAAEHKMIEPFEPGQVRHANGHRIVSYGTSSYGYDIRVSDEFKIFTNINSTMVDPKAFDEKNFVDFRGEVCIIPPNSFALARTVEYFRIPRNVLVVCLGKCVTGDTRVVDADTGAYVPINEMTSARTTVALDDWKLRPARVSEFLPQGRKRVFELRTKAGLRIKATANHPFRQLHGWTALERLRAGDRIAVARDLPVFGRTPIPDWEASLLGLMISEGQTPGDSPAFTSADPALVALLRRCVEAGQLGTTIENSQGGYRLVNHLGGGSMPEPNRANLWLRENGLGVVAEARFVPQKIFTAPAATVRLFLQALFSADGGVFRSEESPLLEYSSQSRRLLEDVHHLLLRFGIFSLIRDRATAIGTPASKIQICGREQIARFAQRVGFCPGSMKQRRIMDNIIPAPEAAPKQTRGNFDTLLRETGSVLMHAARAAAIGVNRLAVHASSSQSSGLATASGVVPSIGAPEIEPLLEGPVWDTVLSIVPAGEEDVFDISVPGPENFVANGLIVHNSTYARCGIIVNVTPLEPEWEGNVTLEFSNTTPLPAKIYANEGVAQVIFFESDEICAVSYKDRGGKYQGQQGVTLPKT